jgi:uncharacterized RmlC-like cupin family protein
MSPSSIKSTVHKSTPKIPGLLIGLLIASAPMSGHAHMVDPSTAQVPATQTIVVPNSGGVTTVRTSTPTVTKQQVQLYRGITKATAGSQQLSINRIILPPGTKGLRHMHKSAETAIYVLEGQSRTLIGPNGEIAVDNKAGDFIFIPANVWHQPMNVTNRPVIAIEARADADDQSNVILAPSQK